MSGGRPWRTVLKYLGAALIAPLAAVVAGAMLNLASAREPAPPLKNVAPSGELGVRIDPGRPTAVVIASNRATEISDFLPPYELLAATEAFNVIVVAPEPKPVPLYNAMQFPSGAVIQPHLSFAEFDTTGVDPALIVVPFLPGYQPGMDREIIDWIVEHAGPETRLLSICAGAEILAATGLLDGRAATSHHRWIPRLELRHPEVEWMEEVRYVVAGNVTTSAGLLSGVDATLATIGRMLGRDAAEAVARRLGYVHVSFLDQPAFSIAPLDLRAVPSAVLRWTSRPVRVELGEGVGETAVASVLDLEGIGLERLRTVTPHDGAIRSRNGLLFLPTAFRDGPFGRLLAPARLRAGAFPYDAVLEALAERQGIPVAQAAATNLVYTTSHLDLLGTRVPRGWVILILLIGAGPGTLAVQGYRRRMSSRTIPST